VTAKYDVAADEANTVKYKAIAFLTIFRVQNKNQYKISPRSESFISVTALAVFLLHIMTV
jgi:hypothetical protein